MHDSSGQACQLLAQYGKVGVVASVVPQCSSLLQTCAAPLCLIVEECDRVLCCCGISTFILGICLAVETEYPETKCIVGVVTDHNIVVARGATNLATSSSRAKFLQSLRPCCWESDSLATSLLRAQSL